MPKGDPRDRFFFHTLTLMIASCSLPLSAWARVDPGFSCVTSQLFGCWIKNGIFQMMNQTKPTERAGWIAHTFPVWVIYRHTYNVLFPTLWTINSRLLLIWSFIFSSVCFENVVWSNTMRLISVSANLANISGGYRVKNFEGQTIHSWIS